LSENAKSRIRRSIDFLELKSDVKVQKTKTGEYKWKLNFLTLHLPAPQFEYKESGKPVTFFKISEFEKGLYIQKFSDKDIKSKVLNQFLTELREVYKVNDYLWKAETQKNGNIHFHLTTNVYLPALEIRERWNRCLNKIGIIDYYHEKFSRMSFDDYRSYRLAVDGKLQLKAIKKAYEFGKKTNWLSPNSTDIHSTKRIVNMAAYLTEYICKNTSDSRLVDGRLWFLSKSLTSYKNKVVVVTEEIKESLEKFIVDPLFNTIKWVDKKTKEFKQSPTVIQSDYVWLFKVPFFKYLEFGLKDLHQIYSQHIKDLINPPTVEPVVTICPF